MQPHWSWALACAVSATSTAARRTAVISYLVGCSSDELGYFVELMLRPFRRAITAAAAEAKAEVGVGTQGGGEDEEEECSCSQEGSRREGGTAAKAGAFSDSKVLQGSSSSQEGSGGEGGTATKEGAFSDSEALRGGTPSGRQATGTPRPRGRAHLRARRKCQVQRAQVRSSPAQATATKKTRRG